jgi:phage host-nuclease inhibitor protein Gam
MSEQESSSKHNTCNIEERLEGELRKIRHEVDDLYETVYKGNGVPSLVTRANNMESKLSGLREIMNDKISHISSENALRFESINQKIDNKFTRLEGWIETKISGVEVILHSLSTDKKIDRTGGWQLKAALITAGVAIAGIVASVLSK